MSKGDTHKNPVSKRSVPLPLWALYWALAVVQLVAVCVVWHLVPDSIPAHWSAVAPSASTQ